MKKSIILCIVILFIITANMYVYAEGIFGDPTSMNPIKTEIGDSFQNIGGIVLSVLQVIGTLTAIVMLMILAIKYMSAAPGEKADIKKSAVVYIVGAIILFAAVGIMGVIKSFSDDVNQIAVGVITNRQINKLV